MTLTKKAILFRHDDLAEARTFARTLLPGSKFLIRHELDYSRREAEEFFGEPFWQRRAVKHAMWALLFGGLMGVYWALLSVVSSGVANLLAMMVSAILTFIGCQLFAVPAPVLLPCAHYLILYDVVDKPDLPRDFSVHEKQRLTAGTMYMRNEEKEPPGIMRYTSSPYVNGTAAMQEPPLALNMDGSIDMNTEMSILKGWHQRPLNPRPHVTQDEIDVPF